ncbi:MAG TPA: hypothetical protein RMG45_22730, partial [Polyangiaceae bacterium LLY-WYZ-15_(1-7)]|nr:hypothetical protein [Polyangiaceae bacterium LLY-WYZ-15_(1-7)]
PGQPMPDAGVADGGEPPLVQVGSEWLPLDSDGPFAFAASVPSGALYEVTIGESPAGYLCEVTSGRGQVADADVTDIEVHCESPLAGRTLRANGDSTCLLDGAGAITCWGEHADSPSAPLLQAPAGAHVDLAFRGDTACGLREDGRVRCWGGVAAIVDPTSGPSADTRAYRDVAVGDDTACGVLESGALTCWGDDAALLADVPAGSFVQLDMLARTACAVSEAGEVRCWGADAGGLVTTPPTTSSESATRVVAGWDDHACALDPDSFGAFGCAGVGPYGETDSPPFAIADIAAGAAHTCALDLYSREARCWGAGRSALAGGAPELGQGQAPEGAFVQIVAGRHHTCALTTDGKVICWGDDGRGQASPPGSCGDGVRDAAEACDDGNTAGGDGCSADCRSAEVCGNGVVDPGELCDHPSDCAPSCAESYLTPCGPEGDPYGWCDVRECATPTACSPTEGCVFAPAADGTACAGGLGVCAGGTCVEGPLAAGEDAACAIAADGTLRCWGPGAPPLPAAAESGG